MSDDVVIASRYIREAFPPREGENVKSRIARAARALGMKYRRARAVWYAEARRIDASEMEAIEHARRVALAARISRLREALACTDADFFAPDLAALEQLELRALRAAGARRKRGTSEEQRR